MFDEVTLSFRAMNTDVEAVVCVPAEERPSADRALGQVHRLFEEIEETLSRFSPGSELSRLNASAGQPFTASPMLFKAVKASLGAARVTGGLFDPTVLAALIEAGYDRSFEELTDRGKAVPAPHAKCGWTWKDIRLDNGSSLICLPAGCALDLGGIGKGWAVDRAARRLQEFRGYAVDAGGDMMVGGCRADGSAWTVGVADPLKPDHDLMVLELDRGAVCTSSTTRRRWSAGGESRHHLIDPRTGQPSQSGIAAATVTADSAARAETITKAAIMLGPKAGLKFIERQSGVEGVLVLSNGTLRMSRKFKGVPGVAA